MDARSSLLSMMRRRHSRSSDITKAEATRWPLAQDRRDGCKGKTMGNSARQIAGNQNDKGEHKGTDRGGKFLTFFPVGEEYGIEILSIG
jgi:hypothetical protein